MPKHRTCTYKVTTKSGKTLRATGRSKKTAAKAFRKKHPSMKRVSLKLVSCSRR